MPPAGPLVLEERRRRRRQRKDQKKAMAARSIHDLPDDSLRLILLRLDSPLWLIRAASVCKRWLRAVTDGADEGRAFLRLASSLHLPTVVGQYHILTSGDHRHRYVPSSSSIDGSRFSVDDFLDKHDFLDKQTQYSRWIWHVADCHGGLVLLSLSGGPCAGSMPDLIVYAPLTRKHWSISGPPTRDKRGFRYDDDGKDVFLLDGDDGHISISNFKVLHRHLNDASGAPTACVFSRGNGGEWGWRFLSRRLSDVDLYPRCSLYAAGRVDGSLYLGLKEGRIIAIDSTSLVFSMVDLPTTRVDTCLLSRHRSSSFTVVHDAGGLGGPTSPQRTSIVHVWGEELELFRRVQGCSQWVLERIIPNLSEAIATRGLLVCPEKKGRRITWSTMASVNADGAAFAILSSEDIYDKFFSIDVNTMQLQVWSEVPYCCETRSIFTYTLPWPQFLRACP